MPQRSTHAGIGLRQPHHAELDGVDAVTRQETTP